MLSAGMRNINVLRNVRALLSKVKNSKRTTEGHQIDVECLCDRFDIGVVSTSNRYPIDIGSISKRYYIDNSKAQKIHKPNLLMLNTFADGQYSWHRKCVTECVRYCMYLHPLLCCEHATFLPIASLKDGRSARSGSLGTVPKQR